MGLVDSDLTLARHVVESLLRVHPRLERRRPRSSVHRRSALLVVVDVLPVDKERDRVFCLGVAADGSGDTGRRGRSDFDGLVSALDHPAVDLPSARASTTSCQLTSMWCELR